MVREAVHKVVFVMLEYLSSSKVLTSPRFVLHIRLDSDHCGDISSETALRGENILFL